MSIDKKIDDSLSEDKDMSNHFEYAGFWRRYAAMFVDNTFISFVSLIYGLMIVAIASVINSPEVPEFFINTSFLPVFFMYHIVCIKKFGYTLGKKLLKCKVVKDKTGETLSWKNSSIRFFGTIMFSFVLVIPLSYHIATNPSQETISSQAADNIDINDDIDFENEVLGVESELKNSTDTFVHDDENLPDYLGVFAIISLTIFIVGYFMTLFNGKRRALHDFMAGSVVIINKE